MQNNILNTNAGAIYLDSAHYYNSEILIEGNVVDSNPYAQCITIAAEFAGINNDIRVFNNQCTRNQHGMWIGGYYKKKDDEGNNIFGFNNGTPMKNFYIVNNTFSYNGESGVGYGLRADNAKGENIYVYNNIISHNKELLPLVDRVIDIKDI